MDGLAQVEYVNISYSNNYRFSDDSHLLITAGPYLKYSQCHDVIFSGTFHRGFSGTEGGGPMGPAVEKWFIAGCLLHSQRVLWGLSVKAVGKDQD